MRHITVGDIHGCIEEFKALLDQVKYRPGEDDLILLGDLLDRGPDPAAVVRFAREQQARCIRGNHEETAIRWRRHEQCAKNVKNYKNPMKPKTSDRLAQWEAIPEEDWKWIASLPNYIVFEKDRVAVHAGCMPGVPIDKQEPRHLNRLRYVHNETGEMVAFNGSDEGIPGTMWYDLWKGPETVVFGHITSSEIIVGKYEKAIGIDTGCYGGGHLTAAIFQDANLERFEQVRAKQVYFPGHLSWASEG